MSDGSHLVEADVCVVGAGIVGLAHAHEARRRGLRVALLERDRRPVGASVRNFGHVFLTSLADGGDHAMGLRSRERWLQLGADAGLTLQQHGTVLVARAEDELAVLEGVAQDPARHARMLTPGEVAQRVPIPVGGLLGGLHCELDLRVDPRSAADQLARLLERDDGAELHWDTHVHAVDPGTVHAGGLTVHAPLTLVCPGPDYRELPPNLRVGLESLTRCQLQMLRIAAPGGRRYGPALATGLSMVRYTAFTAQPAAAALRERLGGRTARAAGGRDPPAGHAAAHGDLVIGDTHSYGDTLAPFGHERLKRAAAGGGADAARRGPARCPRALAGIYPSATPGHFLVTAPLPGVRVVEVSSGLGMTLSFGKAPEILDELLADPAAAGPLASSSAGA